MNFSQIPGQKIIKEKLIRSVKEERVSHAQLFAGPEGCGSMALALAYAQYVSCENRNDHDSCGVCKSCVKYEKLIPVSYTHLRAHETDSYLVCRLLLEKKKK